MYPYEVALSQYGTQTRDGVAHNPAILKYFADIGHAWVKDDETAWCAAFVNWCLLKAGRKQNGKLNARSFLSYGTETQKPRLGDIVVLWRINKKGPYGHVGFFVREEANLIYILGGNQSGQVKVSAYDKTYLLGYRSLPN